jgi:hypothetical protein
VNEAAYRLVQAAVHQSLSGSTLTQILFKALYLLSKVYLIDLMKTGFHSKKKKSFHLSE